MILDRARAEEFFARFYRGRHRIPSEVRDDGRGVWSVSHLGELASFDDDELTRLVMLAHLECVRAWVSTGQPGRLRITIQARDCRSGEMAHGHPTLMEAAQHATLGTERWQKAIAAHGAAPVFGEACFLGSLTHATKLRPAVVRKRMVERCLWLNKRIEERRHVGAHVDAQVEELKATVQALEAFEAFWPAGGGEDGHHE